MSTQPSITSRLQGGPERRRHPRCRVLERQLVTVGLGAERRGLLVDLSATGAAVQPFSPLHAGESSQISLQIPNESVIEAEGVVSWVGPTGRAGIRFTSLQEPDQERLQRWVERLALAIAPLATKQAGGETAAYLPPSYSPWVRMSDLHLEAKRLEEDAQRLDADFTSLDLVSALRLVVERSRKLTNASGAAIALADEESMVCRARTGVAPDLGARFRPESGLSGEAVRTAAVARCTDATDDTRVDRLACERLNVRSILIAPILSGNAVIGVIEAFSPVLSAFGEREEEQLCRMSDLVSAMLENNLVPRSSSPRHSVDRAPLVEREVQQESPANELLIALPGVRTQDQAAEPPTAAAEHVKPSTEQVVEIYNGFIEKAEEEDRQNRRKNVVVAALIIFLGAALFTVWYWVAHRASSTPPTGRLQQSAPVMVEPVSVELPSAAALPIPTVATPHTSPRNAPPAQRSRASAEEWSWKAPREAGTGSELKLTTQPAKADPAPEPETSSTSAGQVKVISDLFGTWPSSNPQLVEGKLIERVDPIFPPRASQALTHGQVIVRIAIGKSGKIEKAERVSGNPTLTDAAVQAIKQWRYEPYQVDGEPVAVEKTITINFGSSQ
jgi:TonB family protein